MREKTDPCNNTWTKDIHFHTEKPIYFFYHLSNNPESKNLFESSNSYSSAEGYYKNASCREIIQRMCVLLLVLDNTYKRYKYLFTYYFDKFTIDSLKACSFSLHWCKLE